VVDLITTQIASVFGLAGIALGWRGGMRRFYGFYDAPTATRYLMYGLVLGAILQIPVLYTVNFTARVAETIGALDLVSTIAMAFVVTTSITLIIALIGRVDAVRRPGAGATTGWTLGLGIGAMLAISCTTFIIQHSPGRLEGALVSIPFGLLLPWMEAQLVASHWSGAKRDAPLRSLASSLAGRCLAVLFLVILLVVFQAPLLILLLLPILTIGQRRADEVWLPSALDPEALRRWRRALIEGLRSKSQVD